MDYWGLRVRGNDEAPDDSRARLLSAHCFSLVLSTCSCAPQDSRIQFIHHAVERACIGHCFSYANYEPSSGEFRVRVRERSPVVTSSTDTAEDMAAGEYEMDESDLPMKQIYQCDAGDLTKLCIRDLKAGDDLHANIGRKPGHR